MAVPNSPSVADRPAWLNVKPIQGTPVQLTSNVTNAATSATQVTGWTVSYKVGARAQWLLLIAEADNVTNSGSNAVVMTAWNGVVGTGTQFGQSTNPTASALSGVFVLPVTSAMVGTTVTLNVGMHGSGAGTNTLVCGATNPATLALMVL